MHPFTKQVLGSYYNSPFAPVSTVVGGVTGVVGLGDLFLGEQNALNSGEFVQNGLITSFVPSSGAVVGALAGGLGNAARARMGRGRMPANQHVVDMSPSSNGTYSAASQHRYRPVEEMNPQTLGRDIAIGATAGTVAASIPAIGYMINDQQGSESIGQALSMKDRAELNDLLETHSDGPAF